MGLVVIVCQDGVQLELDKLPVCARFSLTHLAPQNVAIFIELDTVGSLATFFTEYMGLTDKTTLKLAVGVVCERLAICTLHRLAFLHPELVVAI